MKDEISVLLAPSNSLLPQDFRVREYGRSFGNMLGTALTSLCGSVRALKEVGEEKRLLRQIEDQRGFWGNQVTSRIVAMVYDWTKGMEDPNNKYQVHPSLYEDPTHDSPVIALALRRHHESYEIRMPEATWDKEAAHPEDPLTIKGTLDVDGWERHYQAEILGGVMTVIRCRHYFAVMGKNAGQVDLRQVSYEEGFSSSYVEILARQMQAVR